MKINMATAKFDPGLRYLWICVSKLAIIFPKGKCSFIIENCFERFLHIFINLIMLDLNV